MRTPFFCRWAVAVLLAAATSHAQALFPFQVDQDRLSGAPDFSFLNHPLTAADRIVVSDGHFYNASGERVRFFGMNLAFGANFPTKDDGTRIARRLRRLGVNLVRLHHMDSSPDAAGNPNNAGSILTDRPYPTFNDVSVQRLRDFLSALSAEGIYADLNLHVGYQFRPEVDRIPAVAGRAFPSQSKPLHIFHPRMVQLQQEFTRQLIARLGLRNDPVLALVEIDNETSLVQVAQSNQLDPLLGGEYGAELQAQWNSWLRRKYGSTEELAGTWGPGTPDGAEILNGKWTLEQGHGKTGTLSIVQSDGLATAQVQPGTGSGWLFLKQTGFHLRAGVRYVWTFEARADVAAGQSVNVPTSIMRDVSPWDGFSSPSITLTNSWQTFRIGVTPSFDILDSGRVSLDVEFSPGAVYSRKMSLVEAGQRSLAAGESIESGTIRLVGSGEGATANRAADYTNFLIATDRAYMNSMRDAVRESTEGLVPITGTQVGYGGLSIFDSQDGLDYHDNHFYVDHYNFPNTAWDGFDWRIRDASAADSNWSSFLDLAWSRQSGLPYTVSEYNQPWPNTHGGEIDPALAAFAALQDWDGIMHFAYSHGRGWDDGVPNGFNVNGDWTKFPNIGQSAWIFRSGAVTPGNRLAVPVSAGQRLQAVNSSLSPSNWVARQAGIARETAFTRRVELVKDGAGEIPKPPFGTGDGQLTFDSGSRRVTLQVPQAVGIFGRLDTGKMTAGPLEVDLVTPASAVLLTALDGAALTSSQSMLLSIPGYALRSIPRTSAPQSLITYRGTTDWWTIDPANATTKPSGDLNGGTRPTWMQRVEAWLTIRTRAAKVTVSILDGAGARVADLGDDEVIPVAGGFRIHLNGPGQAASPWFAIRTSGIRRGPRQ